MKYSEQTKLEEIIDNKKGYAILKKHGVPCLSCPMAAMEMSTLVIGEISEIYGLDIKKILQELNKL